MTAEERIEKLETELTRMNWRVRRTSYMLALVCLCLATSTIAWMLAPQALVAEPTPATSREIRARTFILEDGNGNGRAALAAGDDGASLFIYDERGEVRAGLGLDKKGGPALFLSDEEGKDRLIIQAARGATGLIVFDDKETPRATISVGKDGPGIVLSDDRGKHRVAIGVPNSGAPTLALIDENGTMRTGIGLNDKGAPSVTLHDEQGGMRAAIRTDSDGSPMLAFSNEDGKPIIILSKTGGSKLTFYEDGKIQIGLGMTSEGWGGLILNDDRARTRAAFGVSKAGGELGIYDGDGEKLWSAP